jgi:hypothetical protein
VKAARRRSYGVTGGRLAGTRGLAGVTNGGDSVASGDRRVRRLALAIFFAVGLSFAIVNALSELDERARAGRPVETWEPWCWELTSFLSFLLLAPVIFRLSERLWPPRVLWPAALGTHLLLSIPASLAHSLLMIGLREAIYAALGERYGYGSDDLGAILLYEYRKDLISYAVLVALPHVARRLLEVRHAPAPDGRYRIEVRDGSRTLGAGGRQLCRAVRRLRHHPPPPHAGSAGRGAEAARLRPHPSLADRPQGGNRCH